MRQSENINDLSKALCGFHKEVGKVVKSAVNPFFKSKYADLSSVLETVADPLNNNGLVVLQAPETTETGVNLTTRLIHESGQWMETSYVMPVVKANDPQALGSAISYARRYALTAILSLNVDDDDGNAASGKKPNREGFAPAPAIVDTREPVKQPTKREAAQSMQHGIDVKEAIKEALNCGSVSALAHFVEGQPERIRKDVQFQGACNEHKEDLKRALAKETA